MHPVTTPAGREEQGTSLYSSYTYTPHAACTPAGAVPRGSFRRLLHAGIAGSGLLWASQLAPRPAWAGPGRGGHREGRRKQRLSKRND